MMEFEYGRTTQDREMKVRVTMTQDELRAIVAVMAFGSIDQNEISKNAEIHKVFRSYNHFKDSVSSVFDGFIEEEMLLNVEDVGDKGMPTVRINGSHFAIHKLSDVNYETRVENLGEAEG